VYGLGYGVGDRSPHQILFHFQEKNRKNSKSFPARLLPVRVRVRVRVRLGGRVEVRF
jgi:hypothetical protein